MSSRAWCFTLNNYDYLLDDDELAAKGVTFCQYQEECGANGTRHLQGYLEIARAQRLSWVAKLPGLTKAHWEPRRGTQAQAIAYVSPSKDANAAVPDPTFRAGPYIFGTPATNEQGKRSDLVEIRDKIKAGIPYEQIAEEHFSSWCRYEKSFAKFATICHSATPPSYTMDKFLCEPLDLSMPVLLHGPTSLGKTAFALAHFAKPLYVDHVDKLKELRADHDGIVFDDLDFKHWPAQSVIHLLDIDHDHQVHCRFVNAKIPKGMKRIFTFNDDTIFDGPSDAKSTPYSSRHLEAIRRRFVSQPVYEDLRRI